MLLRSSAFAIVLCAASAIPCAAQYSENFDSGTGTPPGWTLDAATGTPAVGWDADGVGPFGGGIAYCVGVVVTPTAFDTAPKSLNFNNDTDIDGGVGHLAVGNALSPTISVTTLAPGTIVRFWCKFNDAGGFATAGPFGEDQKFIEIMDAAGTTVLLSTQICVSYDSDCVAPNPVPPQLNIPCPNTHTPHFHDVDISTIGVTSFRIRFRYNQSADATADAGLDGWYVDTLSVICPDAIPPTTPVNVAPADLSTVIAPPAVTLDWTDATDTSGCGPAPILNYDVEVDTTNPPVAPFTFSATVTISTTSAGVLAPGVYFWRVRSRDVAGNVSTDSTVTSFTVEAPTAPLMADTLHVNENGPLGAQFGDSGFVDPVIDEQPVFSAIYRDGNTTDFATSLRFQVSTDPTFALVDFDSGALVLSPPLNDDTRCPDVTVTTNLARDTIYYWRIQFTDLGGLTGPFSLAQSFHIGDDFDFGVRPGSSNHSRKCWIATSAWGSPEAPAVAALQDWRQGTLETAGAGRMASRIYHRTGGMAAPAVAGCASVRFASSLAASAAGSTADTITAVLLLALLAAGLRRILAR
ncbi:MAG: hypothetical protein HYY18_00915 [Planctomycetes bacterium]|nr:hypothetical protein [Planctomycetota bacterium]